MSKLPSNRLAEASFANILFSGASGAIITFLLVSDKKKLSSFEDERQLMCGKTSPSRPRINFHPPKRRKEKGKKILNLL